MEGHYGISPKTTQRRVRHGVGVSVKWKVIMEYLLKQLKGG